MLSLSPPYSKEKLGPLPIDWVVPTSGCRLAIRGTGRQVGYLNITSWTPVFANSVFPADIEMWSPGSRSEICWLHYKGNAAKVPPPDHPFDYDQGDWDNPDNRYNADLLLETSFAL
jgi:hypothetical protein